MHTKETERIDKFLWAVRLFKTRNKAADACKNKKILIDDSPIKPSRMVAVGDKIKVKIPPAYREFRIDQVLTNRVGAKLVQEYLTEITPPEILSEFEVYNEHQRMQRDRGTGRPTKKDRRDINRFFD